MKRIFVTVCFLIFSITTLKTAQAIPVERLKGIATTEFAGQTHDGTRTGSTEKCIIPAELGEDPQPSADTPLEEQKGRFKAESKLCSYDFYDESYAICPKDNSTNPGTELYKDLPAGVTKEQFENPPAGKYCRAAHPPAKKIAKLKSSLTCSDMRSPLAYYQVSEYLGGVAHIPPAVIRTLDLDRHKELTQIGLTTAIGQYWRQFQTWESDLAAHPRVFASDSAGHDYVIGVLMKNPTDEEPYFGEGEAFRAFSIDKFPNTAAYRAVTAPGLTTQWGLPFNQAAQKIQLMKDAGEMILLDALLSQQDRFGNIHKVKRWHSKVYENGEFTGVKKTSEDDLVKKYRKENPGTTEHDARIQVVASLKASGSVLVNELLLKDNDCGVTKSNRMLASGIVGKIRHLNAKTYNRFIKLLTELTTGGSATRKYFREELLFEDAEMNTLGANATSIKATLEKLCRDNLLSLDADIMIALGKKPLESCSSAVE